MTSFITLTCVVRHSHQRFNIDAIVSYWPLRKKKIMSLLTPQPSEDDYGNCVVKLVTGEEIEVEESAQIIDDMIDTADRLHPAICDNKLTCRSVNHNA
ncbi:MAG: hypothetical protein HQL45_15605 [Alphaproteobacteria bacterium]|nr:hypothetical protein [Alphaproteobacteria bacterium]